MYLPIKFRRRGADWRRSLPNIALCIIIYMVLVTRSQTGQTGDWRQIRMIYVKKNKERIMKNILRKTFHSYAEVWVRSILNDLVLCPVSTILHGDKSWLSRAHTLLLRNRAYVEIYFVCVHEIHFWSNKLAETKTRSTKTSHDVKDTQWSPDYPTWTEPKDGRKFWITRNECYKNWIWRWFCPHWLRTSSSGGLQYKKY